MKLISLFSGIGGFELAAEMIGWHPVVSCEINPFGRKVLEHYWPNAFHHDDIHTLTYERIEEELTNRFGADWRSDDVILTGGFPCQPYSAAGKRLGKEDERHLWPEMLRVIREVQPRWIVGENVLGLVNWNGGLVFHEVQADLEAEGYEVQPFVLPAASVNAPHRRDRVWFVANTNHNGCDGSKNGQGLGKGNDTDATWPIEARQFTGCPITNARPVEDADRNGIDPLRYAYASNADDFDGYISGFRASRVSQHTEAGVFQDNAANSNRRECPKRRDINGEWQDEAQDCARVANRPARFGFDGDAAYPDRKRYEECLAAPVASGQEFNCRHDLEVGLGAWEKFPTQPPVCGGNDGFPSELDGITVSKWRNESIKAYGNAIVPQVALQIFKAIQQYEDLQDSVSKQHNA